MATSPDVVRAQLAIVTAAATSDLLEVASQASGARKVDTLLSALPLVVPSYYDAAGSLAVAWYDELRDESSPLTVYAPTIIGDPTTDWIEREATEFARSLDDVDAEVARMVDEITALADKEVARGFRDTVLGNTRQDQDAIGWSRITRSGACKFCLMLAGQRRAFYRSESTASFGAHGHCHCGARPEFRNGDHGPEANAVQYLASAKRRTPAQQAKVRKYLNENYPDAPG